MPLVPAGGPYLKHGVAGCALRDEGGAVHVRPLGTRRFLPPRDDITEELDRAFEHLTDRSILVVTSKVVSIWEGH